MGKEDENMATTLNENRNVWRSGDWLSTPRRTPPYNGIEITGVPYYDHEGNFASARIIFKDYTFDPRGVTSRIEHMALSDDWVSIPSPAPGSPPAPSSPPGSPPDPPGDFEKFTIRGSAGLLYAANAILLRIRLSYGPEELRREELGFILEFHAHEASPSP